MKSYPLGAQLEREALHYKVSCTGRKHLLRKNSSLNHSRYFRRNGARKHNEETIYTWAIRLEECRALAPNGDMLYSPRFFVDGYVCGLGLSRDIEEGQTEEEAKATIHVRR